MCDCCHCTPLVSVSVYVWIQNGWWLQRQFSYRAKTASQTVERWVDSSGWMRGGLKPLFVCANHCDECGSRGAICCTFVMVDWLLSRDSLLTLNSSTHWIWCLLTVAASVGNKPWLFSARKSFQKVAEKRKRLC